MPDVLRAALVHLSPDQVQAVLHPDLQRLEYHYQLAEVANHG
jgi:hypothetical protein